MLRTLGAPSLIKFKKANTLPHKPDIAHSNLDHSTLALAMIVRDGGQNFASLLQEAQPWVDEIVIGDTGSSDDSLAIARASHARLLEFPWLDDFAAARNSVLAQCQSAWVLVLNADERLSRQDWQQLRRWIDNQSRLNAVAAGRIQIRNYLADRYGRRGWQPVPHPDPHAMAAGAPSAGCVISSTVRVFPNLPEISFQGRKHGSVEASLREAEISVVDLPWPVHHFGYLHQDPQKKQWQLHVAHLKTTEQPHCAEAWAELADCAIGVKNHQQALVAIERSLLLEPGDPEIRLTAGWVLQELGNFKRSDEQLVVVAGLPEVPLHIRAEAAHLRAQVAIKCDRPQSAVTLLTSAIRLLPNNGEFYNTLGSLQLTLGRSEAAQAAFSHACELLPNQAEPCLNLAVMWESTNDLERAAEQYAEALRRDPSNAQALAGQQKITPEPAY